MVQPRGGRQTSSFQLAGGGRAPGGGILRVRPGTIRATAGGAFRL